jgi:hypothetical protein
MGIGRNIGYKYNIQQKYTDYNFLYHCITSCMQSAPGIASSNVTIYEEIFLQ